MAKYVITGGQKLSGSISLSGSKNSVLPCLAASLLTDKQVTLKNVPNIVDVEVTLQILTSLGAEVSRSDHQVSIQIPEIKSTDLPDELTSKLRASILLVGPLLARSKQAKFSHPGGDVIGKRSIDAHLEGFKQLGFEVVEDDKNYSLTLNPTSSPQTGIFMDEPSCTACENLLLATALNQNTIILRNCPEEPQIVDLCNMLTQMGVKIDGIGTSTLKITGQEQLQGADFTVPSDYIELGTYAIAAAISGGEVILQNCSLTGLEPVIMPLQKMGLKFQEENNGIRVSNGQLKSVEVLKTNIWPGFPTDMMSALIVLATQAQGISLLHDWMYESRMFFVDKLISMGAEIIIADPHRVIVHGPTKLHPRFLETPDIRAGMALVLAALVADGESTINRAELIERGYENVVGKLSQLGAQIKRFD